MEKTTTNLTAAVVDDNFEKFAEDANQLEISERLGTKKPPEVAKPTDEPAEVAEVEEQPEKPVAVPKRSIHKLTPGQLRARVRELEAELRGVSRTAREPEIEVVEPEPEPEKPKELRARPKLEDKLADGKPKYENWEQYEDDLLEWQQEKTLRAIDERNSKTTQEAQIAEVNKVIEQGWNDKCEAAREAHEDFDDCLDPKLGPGKLIEPGSVVDRWILSSDHGAELLYYFHHNPGDLKKFEQIKGMGMEVKAARLLLSIEEKISGTVRTDEKPLPAPSKETPLKRTPPPSREVGGRASVPVDRARAAVANDDTGSYIDEMNRREIREKFGDYRR